MAVAIAREDYTENFGRKTDDSFSTRGSSSTSRPAVRPATSANAVNVSAVGATSIGMSAGSLVGDTATLPKIPTRSRRNAPDRHSTPRRGASQGSPNNTPQHDSHSAGDHSDDDHLAVARHRVRRAHKHHTLSIPVMMIGVLLLLQLTAVLYVKALGLSAAHRADKLDNRITQLHDEIKQKQRAISVRTSTPQLEVWSKQLGLRRVQQNDIDRISETARPKDGSLSLEAARGDVP
jgi:hypothetical protein